MFGIGAGEIFVVFLFIFLLFGPKALGQIARSLGEAVRMFKGEIEGRRTDPSAPKKPTQPPSDDSPENSSK
jgi:TatA/E family protein of Tat protein translocase